MNAHAIARAIALQTLARRCVVLVDNCNWTGHECDVLGVTTNLRIIDVEIKISRADFKADAKKDKWWHRMATRREQQADGSWQYVTPPGVPKQWPQRVWKHYFCLPEDIWRPELVEFLPSPASGVLLAKRTDGGLGPVAVTCVRRAKPNPDAYRLSPEQAVDIARLANLRMWEAYRARDAKTAAGAPT
jgi:hypothetical protein